MLPKPEDVHNQSLNLSGISVRHTKAQLHQLSLSVRGVVSNVRKDVLRIFPILRSQKRPAGTLEIGSVLNFVSKGKHAQDDSCIRHPGAALAVG